MPTAFVIRERVPSFRFDLLGEHGCWTHPVRLLICDDHALVRAGLRRLLEADAGVVVVEEAGSAAEVVQKAQLEKPDVILLDLIMPGGSGLHALPELLTAAPQARILVLSMEDDPSYVRDAFAAGASGYLLKDAADVELLGAVRQIAAGGRYLHPALGARLATATSHPQPEEESLSDRERQVLHLLALGNTNQEIATTLYISVRTAEAHRANIIQKLKLSSRADLVRYAIALGMLDGRA